MTGPVDTPRNVNVALDLNVLARVQELDADGTLSEIESRAADLIENDVALVEGLVELRKRHGLSQADVAVRMGVSQPTVSAFEKYDANPRLSTIRRYALAVEAEVSHTVRDVCAGAGNSFVSIVSAVARTSTPVIVTSGYAKHDLSWQFDDWAPAALIHNA